MMLQQIPNWFEIFQPHVATSLKTKVKKMHTFRLNTGFNPRWGQHEIFIIFINILMLKPLCVSQFWILPTIYDPENWLLLFRITIIYWKTHLVWYPSVYFKVFGLMKPLTLEQRVHIYLNVSIYHSRRSELYPEPQNLACSLVWVEQSRIIT